MTASTTRLLSVAMPVLAIATVCALLLGLPGKTVTARYLNDLFIFLDGAHRIAAGQIPNQDFHTALGPLVYYVPAAGYWLSGNFGGAMPVGVALLILTLSPVAAWILSSRLRPAIALPLAAFLFLIAAVPLNPGDSIGALSFGMFYNRIGWVALGFLLIMYVQPAQPHRYQNFLDALCATVLIILMLYMKISYGIVGLGFLVLMLLDPHQRTWAATSLVLVPATSIAIESLWSGTAAHVRDLLLAGQVSGRVSSIDTLFGVMLRNLPDYLLFALFAVLALRRTRSLRDFLFFGFCAGAGFMLILQNFQPWGIFTLPVGAAVAVELLARKAGPVPEKHRRHLTAGAPILLLVVLLPAGLYHAAALGLHASLAYTEQGQPVSLPKFNGIRLVDLQTEQDHRLFTRYLASLEDGARALERLKQSNGRVLVLDFVSPFSAGLALPPPQGDSTWHHWGRTVNEENHLPADELFRTVQVVMDPKWPIEVSTADGLRALYADYIEKHFELAKETADWKLYERRKLTSDRLSRSLGSSSTRTLLEDASGDLHSREETPTE